VVGHGTAGAFGTRNGGESWLEMPLPQGAQHVCPRSIRPKRFGGTVGEQSWSCDHVVSRRLNTAAGAAFRAGTHAAIFLALDCPV